MGAPLALPDVPVPDSGVASEGAVVVGLAVAQGLPVVAAKAVVVGVGMLVTLPVALGVVGVTVTVGLGLGVTVGVLLAGLVLVLLLAGLVLVLLLAGLVLVLLLAGLVLVLLLAGLVLVLLLAGLVLVLLASSDWDGEELDGHAVACALVWLLDVLVWLLDVLVWLLDMLLGVAPSGEEPIGLLLDPSVPWDPPLLPLWEVIPTAEPICTKAWRSGGTARATPMANTAQAAARPDRSSTSRRSRG